MRNVLVHHEKPDLEVAFMSYVIRTYREVRDALGVVENPAFAFTKAGSRRDDLADDDCLYIDCGGDELDQHGKPEHENRNAISSLGYLTHDASLHVVAPHLVPLISIVEQNDLRGTAVAKGDGYKNSETPHTPRHIRNIILGLNHRYKDHPGLVVAIVHAILGVVDMNMKEVFEKNGPAVLASFDFSTFLVASSIIAGAPAYFTTTMGADSPDAIARAVRRLTTEINASLVALEQEWELGEHDYNNNAYRRMVDCRRQTSRGVLTRRRTIVVGTSISSRFGSVTRRNGECDITIQFYGPGKFVISTSDQTLVLDNVAAKLREADLVKKGVTTLTAADRLLFTRPGNMQYADKDGVMHDALFLAEFRTALGNAFRSNMDAESTTLTEVEVVDITVAALAELT